MRTARSTWARASRCSSHARDVAATLAVAERAGLAAWHAGDVASRREEPRHRAARRRVRRERSAPARLSVATARGRRGARDAAVPATSAPRLLETRALRDGEIDARRTRPRRRPPRATACRLDEPAARCRTRRPRRSPPPRTCARAVAAPAPTRPTLRAERALQQRPFDPRTDRRAQRRARADRAARRAASNDASAPAGIVSRAP